MPKKNIVILGGGFAGVSAMRRLDGGRNPVLRKDFDVILVDRKESFEFLPMAPEMVAGRLRPGTVSTDLNKLALASQARFIRDEVREVDFSGKKLFLTQGELDYAYLIICSGSEPNFFNNEDAQRNCLKLNNFKDAVRIHREVLQRAGAGGELNIVVVGGGYTGIETASNVSYFLKKKNINGRIFILEKAPSILVAVPEWLRNEIRRELESCGIEVICGDSLKAYDGKTVTAESGKTIDHALCVWTAGVKTSSFIDKLDVPKRSTRIRVREDLTIEGLADEHVFVTGDAASFSGKGQKDPLRMAVMFAMGQGQLAADNVTKRILGKPLAVYHPADLGYLIPLPQGKAPGIIMGNRVHARLGFILHYLMCLYRAEWRNKWDIVRDLLWGVKTAEIQKAI